MVLTLKEKVENYTFGVFDDLEFIFHYHDYDLILVVVENLEDKLKIEQEEFGHTDAWKEQNTKLIFLKQELLRIMKQL